MDPNNNQNNNQVPPADQAAPQVPVQAPLPPTDPTQQVNVPPMQQPPVQPMPQTVAPAAAPQVQSTDQAQMQAATVAPQAASASGKKNVLLVDDEKETSTVFQVGLSTGGYNVTVAENGKSALDTAKQSHFDLILLDQMMPDMSGNDVLRALKADEATRSIPIAMLTNFGHDEMVKEALNLGANDYILKYRVEAKDLVEKVKSLIGI